MYWFGDVDDVGRHRGHGVGRARAAAFTIIETLIVVAVIAVLLSILLPTLSAARQRMKMLKCSANLRTVGIEFQLFVEGHTPKGQGDSERLGTNRFHINDFLDYLYRVDEFWNIPEVAVATMHAVDETMMCPAGPSELTKRAGSPCGSTAIVPPQSVTLAANMRLYRAPMTFMGGTVLAPAALTRVRASVLQHPYVPLVMDLDGPAAVARGLAPFYTAPSLGADDESSYGTGQYWMPSKRHGDATAVVFVGGSVLSSRRPEEEPWDWAYQADIGR